MANPLDGVMPVLLMGPGPSCVHDDVYAALGKPTLGHLDPYFITIMDAVKEKLQAVMKTKNKITFAVSGTGSSGMEACFVNLVEPGDRILVVVNGAFGARMKEVAERLGAKVDALEFEWGTPVNPEVLAEKLKNSPYSLVAMVHAETSTGIRNPAEEAGKLAKNNGALFLLDCVTSLGCIPVETDAWNVDAVYGCSQKGLSCPPGLAPISFSQRAADKLHSRKTKVPNWSLDVSLLEKYWDGPSRAYHHTMSSNLTYALHAGLDLLLQEGLENVFARHEAAHKKLGEGLAEFGIGFFAAPEHQLPQINAVVIPEGVDDAAVRTRLLHEFRIEIGSGLGPLTGKIWRIGLLGHAARSENVDKLLNALAVCLK